MPSIGPLYIRSGDLDTFVCGGETYFSRGSCHGSEPNLASKSCKDSGYLCSLSNFFYHTFYFPVNMLDYSPPKASVKSFSIGGPFFFKSCMLDSCHIKSFP
ncbi:hypothetical protein AMECASPLE_022467 [Ameca splendens]|uniref:Uncharacterized protein n=1 Tax=Ameca splendens TaxID=208324 RepID=A0ABV0YS17_9TELE